LLNNLLNLEKNFIKVQGESIKNLFKKYLFSQNLHSGYVNGDFVLSGAGTDLPGYRSLTKVFYFGQWVLRVVKPGAGFAPAALAQVQERPGAAGKQGAKAGYSF
jgi:hypothetical protein